MVGGAGVSNAGEPPFEIRGFSLGNAVLFGGLGVTFASFVDYLGSAGGDGLSVSGEQEGIGLERSDSCHERNETNKQPSLAPAPHPRTRLCVWYPHCPCWLRLEIRRD